MGRKLKINFITKKIDEWIKRIIEIIEKRDCKTKFRVINERKKKLIN